MTNDYTNLYGNASDLFLFLFCPFRAAPTAYGGSQARGQTGAVAAGLGQSYSNTRSGLHL